MSDSNESDSSTRIILDFLACFTPYHNIWCSSVSANIFHEKKISLLMLTGLARDQVNGAFMHGCRWANAYPCEVSVHNCLPIASYRQR